jgi:hypothetical protein
MYLLTNEAGYVLGALLLFHATGRLMGFGGQRVWNHLVIWTGMTCGAAGAWAMLLRDILPWGYRDLTLAAKAYQPYQNYFQLYLGSLIIFHGYYIVSSLIVDWFDLGGKGTSTRWPGVWWTFTHIVVVPLVVCGMVLDHALNLRPVAVSVFVSILLRYQLWLAKDSAIQLLVAVSADQGDAVAVDGEDTLPATINSWSYLWFVLHLARVHSLVQLSQWWMDCMPLMGLQWALKVPWQWPVSWTVPWF